MRVLYEFRSEMQVVLQSSNEEALLAHFDLSNDLAYRAWREQKLANYPKSPEELVVHIDDPLNVSASEQLAIMSLLQKTNMCLYQVAEPGKVDKAVIKSLAAKFGYIQLDANICADEDSISSLETKDSGRHAGYIPYSNKKISWHTDGYYNQPENTIRGMILHCVNNAPVGGENQLLDQDILYIHLRDESSDYIRALMDMRALTIPPNDEVGAERAAQTGPVFSLDKKTNRLHLRYTARTRSIQWDDNPALNKALEAITFYLESDGSYIFRHKLRPGQGVLCNNVLHNRAAFEEGDTASSKRLLYRARYYDCV